MSSRFDCCFNLAIMAKLWLSNEEGCPDLIAASDSCCRLLLGFRLLLFSRALIMGSELCLVTCSVTLQIMPMTVLCIHLIKVFQIS